jgi:hypothetical protein
MMLWSALRCPSNRYSVHLHSYCFVGCWCFRNVNCIDLSILVSNMIFIYDVRVVWECYSSEAETANSAKQRSSPSVLSGIRVARSLVFCVVCCVGSFVPLSIFVWSLYFLSLFNLRLLLTHVILYYVEYMWPAFVFADKQNRLCIETCCDMVASVNIK